MGRRIEVLDTTLRDGAQGEGVSFSVEDRIKIARALDKLGVDYIEAGNPAASRRDAEAFAFFAAHPLTEGAELAAFGSTCHAHVEAAVDDGLAALIASGAKVISLFGKSWSLHVSHVLGVSKAENLRMIRDSVTHLTSLGRRVFFDAEHFFDGFRADPDYAMATLEAAASAGAELLVLCDTNGGALPWDIGSVVERVTGALKLPIAIHCHNDAGLATAGTLCAVSAGASQVQGTMNGYGERCGNANLCEVIPNLMLKLGFDALNNKPLSNMTPAARYISEIANAALNPRAPYVGRSAFAHKGGMHIDAMLKDDRTFEHVPPESIGNGRRYLISEMAGRGALAAKLNALAPGITKGSDEAARLTEMLKALESEGYTFEDAENSLELRVLGALGSRAKFFDVTDFHVLSHLADGEDSARAYVKVRVDGTDEITADQGNGPIAALDKALRKALSRFFPDLNRMRLSDFKVRVVGGSGTSSKVRVHIESTDESETWATVGVSGNILEASFIALTDSIEYMLMKNSRRAQP